MVDEQAKSPHHTSFLSSAFQRPYNSRLAIGKYTVPRTNERAPTSQAAVMPLAFGAVLFALLWLMAEELKPGTLLPGACVVFVGPYVFHSEANAFPLVPMPSI